MNQQAVIDLDKDDSDFVSDSSFESLSNEEEENKEIKPKSIWQNIWNNIKSNFVRTNDLIKSSTKW